VSGAADYRIETLENAAPDTRSPAPSGRLLLRAYLWVAALALMLYVPYVLQGGYVTDDWGHLKNAQDFPQYWRGVRHYFPLMSHRPLAPFVVTAQTALVGDRPWAYILVNLTFWFGFAALLCSALARELGQAFAVILAAFLTVPVLASAAVFWSLAMTAGTLSCLLWAFSLWLLVRALERGRYSLLPYLPLLACMATYEAVLPLFALTVLLPILRHVRRGLPLRPALRALTMRYLLPPAVIALLPALSQKLLVPWLLPHLGCTAPPVTRIDLSLSGAALGGASWAFALSAGQVLLWAHGAWAALTDWNVALRLLPMAGAAVWALASAARISPLADPQPAAAGRGGVLCVLLVCLAAGSVVFLFSGQLACFSGGCSNRTLMATSIAEAMVLAWLAAAWRGRVVSVILVTILIASAAGMIVQEDNFVRSWQLQRQVRSAYELAVKEADMAGGATVVSDVPRVVGDECFAAPVFQTPWDWGAMVAMPSGARGDQGAVMGKNQPPGLEVTCQGDGITVHGWWGAKLDEVWFFRYDAQFGAASLRKIRDVDDWNRTARDVERLDLNPRPLVLEERLALKFFGTLGN
jgi:hypothetical protein